MYVYNDSIEISSQILRIVRFNFVRWIKKILVSKNFFLESYLEGYSWQSSRPSFTPMALGIRSGGGDCHKEYFISTIVVPFLFWGCEAIVSFLRASDQFNAADVRDPTFTRSFIR